MKKYLLLIATFALALSAAAQAPHHRGHGDKERHPDITEIVSDLSAVQKRKLETITTESKNRVGNLRAQQKAVRDSISTLMDADGDHSQAIFPLFEREARIQTEISREMYTTKVRIDQVLTREQRQELRSSAKQRRDKKGSPGKRK